MSSSGDRRRERRSRAGGEAQSRFDRERLWNALVEAGPILSLSGVVIFIGGFVVWLTIRELQGPGQLLMALATLMLVTAAATNLPAVKSAVRARAGRYAANTIVMVIALTAILALLGFISYENSYRLDLTATRQFTLAPQTELVLDSLAEPVHATIYSSPEDTRHELIRRQSEDFFFEFNRRNRSFSYDFIDPDLTPSQARRDGVTEYPTIAFRASESERNPYLLTPQFFGEEFTLAEQDLVSALLISTGEQQKVVYFTTGHSERNPTDSRAETDGYGIARAGLLGDNYIIRTLNLREVEEVPEDAAVLIMAGPSNSILRDERDTVERYLRAGGRALFLIDDAINTQMNSLFAKFGVQLPQGTLVDSASSTVSDPRSPIIRRSAFNQDHPVTRPLDDSFLTDSTGIVDIIEKAPEGLPPNPDEINIALTPLAFSSIFSCITVERDASDCSDEDDIPGPFPLIMEIQAIAIVGEETPTILPGEEPTIASMIIFGDSDFASNRFYYALNNSDLFLNSVDWLAQKYDLISIRAKPHAFRLLVIDQREFDFIRYSSWFLLPTGIMLFAGIAWWRRR